LKNNVIKYIKVMTNKNQIASDVKYSRSTSTFTHETRKNAHWFSIFVIGALAIAIAFTSCQKDNDKVKLLETMTYPDGSYYKYEYDSHYRITKWSLYYSSGDFSEFTITYSGNELTKMTFPSDSRTYEFAKDGNKITNVETIGSTVYTRTFYLNGDGLLEKDTYEEEVYSYVRNYLFDNGNLVKWTWDKTWIDGEDIGEENSSREFKYDKNKSPMYHGKTPKWFLIWNFSIMGSQNNVTEEKSSETITTYEYEYDNDGFPTKRTQSNNGFVTEYRYIEL